MRKRPPVSARSYAMRVASGDQDGDCSVALVHVNLRSVLPSGATEYSSELPSRVDANAIRPFCPAVVAPAPETTTRAAAVQRMRTTLRADMCDPFCGGVDAVAG